MRNLQTKKNINTEVIIRVNLKVWWTHSIAKVRGCGKRGGTWFL